MEKYEPIASDNLDKNGIRNSKDEIRIQKVNFYPLLITLILSLIFCIIFYFSTIDKIQEIYGNKDNSSSNNPEEKK